MMQVTGVAKMRRKSFAEMACPIARTLDVVGEWWTLLIVRDALVGARRFDEFRASGIADNILSARLDLLVREGILERRAYQQHQPRYEYLLTEKGRDLLPVITGLGMWGLKWTEGPGKAPRFVHTRCDAEVAPTFHCPGCDEAVQPREIRVERRTAAAIAANGSGAKTAAGA
jgi:DNA-binding HxlR family transcriptional regulator